MQKKKFSAGGFGFRVLGLGFRVWSVRRVLGFEFVAVTRV